MKQLFESFEYNDIKNISGLTNELKAVFIYEHYMKTNKNILILTSSVFESSMYYEKLKAYTNKVFFFPMDEFITSVAVATSPEFAINRLDTLNSINKTGPSIIITNLMGFLKFLPSKATIDKSIVRIKKIQQ